MAMTEAPKSIELGELIGSGWGACLGSGARRTLGGYEDAMGAHKDTWDIIPGPTGYPVVKVMQTTAAKVHPEPDPMPWLNKLDSNHEALLRHEFERPLL